MPAAGSGRSAAYSARSIRLVLSTVPPAEPQPSLTASASPLQRPRCRSQAVFRSTQMRGAMRIDARGFGARDLSDGSSLCRSCDNSSMRRMHSTASAL